MLIHTLELQGYKRLLLNNIKYIKLDPRNKIQLILGTNGSGKSSLLKELNPLPAIQNEFEKDGFKVIEISHNNSHYVLKSLFTNGVAKYQFIKDEEELNPGQTVTIFKELVKKEFNITQDIQNVLVGINNFHSMSSAERRDWFTNISHCDYTFALSYYKKIKEKLRDVQGALKLNQSRYVQESSKLITEDEEKTYSKEITELQTFLNFLLEHKSPIVNSKDIRTEMNGYEIKLKELTKIYRSQRKLFINKEGYTTIETIDDELVSNKCNEVTYSDAITHLEKEILDAEKTVKVLQETNVGSFDELSKTIEEDNQKYSKLNNQIRLKIKFENNKESSQALASIYENLTEIFLSIEANPDKLYSRENYKNLLQVQTELISLSNNTEELLRDLYSKKKHYDSLAVDSNITCPNCDHKWIKDYDYKQHGIIKKSIEVHEQNLIKVKADLEVKNELVSKMNEYIELYRVYVNIVKSWSSLKPLWEYITIKNYLLDNPKFLTSVLNTVKEDLLIGVELDELKIRIENNFKLKDSIIKNREDNVNELILKLETLNEQLLTNTKLLKQTKINITRLLIYKKTAVRLKELSDEIESIVNSREDRSKDLFNNLRSTAINEMITHVRYELNRKETILSKIDSQKLLVKDIKNQIDELTEKAIILKLAVKELSPTEGLIARSMTNFINQFIKQVNNFIKKIWLYPLEIMFVSSGGDVELDYKFPVLINGDINITDVSKGSSAMQEIIDLAFRIVSMKYLQLDRAPIYLDEFARTFDSEHRKAAYYAITNLLTSTDTSQIFMISHFENNYGSMKNTDIIVLCSNNIVLSNDTVFNENVVIK